MGRLAALDHERSYLFLVGALACAAVVVTAAPIAIVQSSEAPSARSGSLPMTSWQVEIETSGGFSGRGLGGVVINSEGRVEASTETKKCSARLTPQELESMARVILRAKPLAWRSAYQRPGNPHGGADQFQYTLRLTVDSKAYETFWYEVTAGARPRDLLALTQVVWKARESVVAKCIGDP
jgi:hypothetical protein